MEGAPYIPENDPSLEILEKKKASVETIGSLIVESKPEQATKSLNKEKLGQALLDMEVRKHEAETSFELDPVIRRHNAELELLGNPPEQSLNKLLQKADTVIDKKAPPITPSTTKPVLQSAPKTKGQSRIIDIAMISTIVILALLVAILLITRK